ncbi:hypothetical protein AAFC00_000553 [Neodothiora populina]|uniref:ABC transporter n=1 Tax=Neodothiora populina TaxID=2781224 RepID=A0ABR3PDA5_9PEZI
MPSFARVRRFGRNDQKAKDVRKEAIELHDLSENGNAIDDRKTNDAPDTPWKALFFFTDKSHLTCLVVAIVSGVLSGVASPAAALLVGKAFQAFTNFTDTDQLVRKESRFALNFLLVGIGSWILHFVFFAAWVAFGELQANSARNRLFYGMLVKETEWYDLRKNGIGALIPRLQVQIRELQLATSQPLGSLVTIAATALFNIGLALFYSWKLTLVIISTVPLIVTILGYLGASMQPNVKKQQDSLADALKYVNSALSAIETVKCFNGQDDEIVKYKGALASATVWYMRVVNINALQFALTVFITSAMFVQGFYYGGVLIRKGEKTAGDVVTTFVAALGAFQAISAILPQMIVLEKGRTAGATLRAVLTQIENGSSVSRSEGVSTIDNFEGNIVLRGVSFAYPTRPSQMALRDVNLFIPGGVTTFIVGQSGSGKSTLGQLLMRFYAPNTGEILLDGCPLPTLDVTWLRTQITLVEQQSVLFADTLYNNIASGTSGSSKVSDEEVKRAVEFALLQLMINDLPQGLDTIVGTKGESMSGGQRQRMALARAYVRNSPVLLLDESTSALDQISRALVMEAIRKWRQGRTTVIITHDIPQILPNDYAVVLKQGRLVQEGYRKHMEKLKGSPFQDFLSEEQQAQLSPFDSRRHDSEDLSLRIQSTDAGVIPEAHLDHLNDPLGFHLAAGEQKRTSFRPSAFVNTHTSMVLQGAGRSGRPISTFRPMHGTNEYSLSRISTHSSGINNDTPESQIRDQFAVSDQKIASPMTETPESFLDRTGAFASRARLHVKGHRQRLPSEPSADDSAIEGKSQSFMNRIRRPKPPHDMLRTDDGVLSVSLILRTIWPNIELRPRLLLLVGVLSTVLGAASAPVFSFILSKLIHTYGRGSQGQHQALVYSLSILGVSGVTAVCAYLQHICLEYAGQQWVNRIREKAMEAVLDQPRDFFAQEINSISRITEGLDRHAEEMRNLLGRFAATVLTAAIMISVTLVWALVTQWKITLIALSVGPYVWIVTRAFASISAKWEARSNDASDVTGSIFFETFTAIKTVRALTLEKKFSEKYFQAIRATLVVGVKRAFWTGFFFGLSDIAGDLVMALIFYAGGIIVRDGASAPKVLEVFIQLVITINNVSNLLNLIPQMSSSREMASRILRLSQLPRDSHEHSGNTRITTTGDIVFTDLSFAYPSQPDQRVLKNVSLVIPSGKCTAVVGSSGSGKSTVAALLVGLYATSRDAHRQAQGVPDLMVSGRDIKHIHTPTLRSLIAVVAQSPVIFAATVADNIAYGLSKDSPFRSIAAIRIAAASAGIDDFISTLPEAYSTRIGEGGVGLSGGQAQRIAIARAIVRRPAVLILDEATSALDVENAALVRRTIQSLATQHGGMTIIIITHSTDMMAIADNIIVLEQGQVVEQGNFSQLLAQGGGLSHLVSEGLWGSSHEGRKRSSVATGLTDVVNWSGSTATRLSTSSPL